MVVVVAGATSTFLLVFLKLREKVDPSLTPRKPRGERREKEDPRAFWVHMKNDLVVYSSAKFLCGDDALLHVPEPPATPAWRLLDIVAALRFKALN